MPGLGKFTDIQERDNVFTQLWSPVLAIEDLALALSVSVLRTVEKLRRGCSHTLAIMVFLRTSYFRSEPQYSGATVVQLRRATDNTHHGCNGRPERTVWQIYGSCRQHIGKIGCAMEDASRKNDAGVYKRLESGD